MERRTRPLWTKLDTNLRKNANCFFSFCSLKENRRFTESSFRGANLIPRRGSNWTRPRNATPFFLIVSHTRVLYPNPIKIKVKKVIWLVMELDLFNYEISRFFEFHLREKGKGAKLGEKKFRVKDSKKLWKKGPRLKVWEGLTREEDLPKLRESSEKGSLDTPPGDLRV